MIKIIGIRDEDMYPDELRVPLIPEDVKYLKTKKNIEFWVERSTHRAFTDSEYEAAGAKIVENLEDAQLIIGVKEVSVEKIYPEKIYMFFSHTIKGQKKNMPMLRMLLEQKATLIDYEKITDDNGRRLIFFGRYAGLAGMINTLWTLGQRLLEEGIVTPLSKIKQALNYKSLEEARRELKRIGEEIFQKGLPTTISPLIIGIFGYGNVSRGAQEILDLFPVKELSPEELNSEIIKDLSANYIYKVVFKEKDMVTPKDVNKEFDLQDYYKHPENYKSVTDKYLPYLSVIVNCIYWDARYPRILTKDQVKNYWKKGDWRLKAIGDISCDVEGAIECTVEETRVSNPVYVYYPEKDEIAYGFSGDGIPVMAVSTLPAELPRESSTFFSNILKEFIMDIVEVNWNSDFSNLKLNPELKRAIIVYKGKLTPDYAYLKKYL